jgi:hypothetical protein
MNERKTFSPPSGHQPFDFITFKGYKIAIAISQTDAP